MANLKKSYQAFKKLLPLNVLVACLFFVSGMVALNSEKQKIEGRVLGLKIEEKINQETIVKWEQIVNERPNYRDAWVQLAVLYYKNSDPQKAKQALSQARQIDPNNQDLLKLERLWSY